MWLDFAKGSCNYPLECMSVLASQNRRVIEMRGDHTGLFFVCPRLVPCFTLYFIWSFSFLQRNLDGDIGESIKE